MYSVHHLTRTELERSAIALMVENQTLKTKRRTYRDNIRSMNRALHTRNMELELLRQQMEGQVVVRDV